MIRIAKIEEFLEISRQNKTFIWHFLKENQCKTCLGLFSYFDTHENKEPKMKQIVDLTGVPYFESYTKDSIDFLISNGIPGNIIWKERNYSPLVISVKNGVIINHTGRRCYCPEYIVEMIGELNPDYLLNAV